MIPNLWRLQYDPTPLTDACSAWTAIADKAEYTADRILAAARRVVGDTWESEAAERFEQQHRAVVAGLDSTAAVAREIARALAGIGTEITTTQTRLDREWAFVNSVPHEYVGAEQILLFWPDGDTDRDRVLLAMDTARTIRTELDDKLYTGAGSLDTARSTFDQSSGPFVDPGGSDWDPGSSLAGGAESSSEVTTVSGTPQSPAGLVPGVGPVAFSAPALDTSLGGALAGGLMGRAALARAVARSTREGAGAAGPMAGGMPVRAGGGAMGGGAGRGGRRATGPQVLRGSGRAGETTQAQEREKARQEKLRAKVEVRVVEAPSVAEAEEAADQPVTLRVDTHGDQVVAVPAGPSEAELEAAREEAARRAEEEAAREAKRDEVEERRAARAARRAARQSEPVDA